MIVRVRVGGSPEKDCYPTGTVTDISTTFDGSHHQSCRNVSHSYRQQSFSGLPLPRLSHYMINCYSWVQIIYCTLFLLSFLYLGLLYFIFNSKLCLALVLNFFGA